ncbi:hypothetical protein HX798_26630 [Pseudomonas putida]|uniref:Uncharacterized protein n=1 Tax=Pseudomonas putida TaxID=303 RepID=A0A7Y7ZG64_PSEPU|nr:hypothetical protein [Pseudomonas putida]NWC83833.1 hypothetical protein [Pseudomonas putida]
MNPITAAARLMGKRKIVRTGTAKKDGSTIFLWELDDGATLELIRGRTGFTSLQERRDAFQDLVDYYSRGAKVFVPRLSSVA